jgi:hypothetical protein
MDNILMNDVLAFVKRNSTIQSVFFAVTGSHIFGWPDKYHADCEIRGCYIYPSAELKMGQRDNMKFCKLLTVFFVVTFASGCIISAFGYEITRNVEIDKKKETVKCKLNVITSDNSEYGVSIFLPQEVYLKTNDNSNGRIVYETFDFLIDSITLAIEQKALESNADLITVYADRVLNKQDRFMFNPIKYVTIVKQAGNGADDRETGLELFYQGEHFVQIAGFLAEFPAVLVLPETNTIIFSSANVNVPNEMVKIRKRLFVNQMKYLESLKERNLDIFGLINNNKTVVLQISNEGCFDDKILTQISQAHNWIHPVFLFTNSFPEARNMFPTNTLPEFVMLFKRNFNSGIDKNYDNLNMKLFSLDCSTLKTRDGLDDIIYKKIMAVKGEDVK